MAKQELEIEYHEELPVEFHSLAERSLRNGISFLESVPRPTGNPEIQFLTPDFSKMKFSFGNNCWPHGLFSKKTMAGWCVLSVKTSGDLLINSEPVVTVPNVDVEICTTASIVFVLDQYFLSVKSPELHLHQQLSYLDSLASSNAKVKSLLDRYEESVAAKEKEARREAYLLQFPTKRKLRLDAQAESRRIKNVPWFDKKYRKPSTVKHEAPPTVPQPPPPPREPPQSPELNEFEALAVARHRAMWKFIEQEVESNCSTD